MDSGREIATPAALAGIVAGLIVAATFREGAFYPADAALVLTVSLVVTAVLMFTRPDRRAVVAVGAVGACALWWFIRAAGQGRPGAFLPFGASLIGFACAFLATRRLSGRYRVLATQLVVAVGAVSAGAGLVATTARWYPLAMPAQNLWRLATTLTYSNAAGALLAVATLVGIGLDQRGRTNRLMVCLCAAGLVATQSRGAVLGAIVGAALVPLGQWRRAALPVGLGVLGGLAVVATSSGGSAQPLATVAVVVVVVLSVVAPRRAHVVGAAAVARKSPRNVRRRVVILVGLCVATVGYRGGRRVSPARPDRATASRWEAARTAVTNGRPHSTSGARPRS